MEFKAEWSLLDTLKQAQTEKTLVGLFLRSGATMSGRVEGVGNHNVVLGHIVGKEFYDALIRVEDISAIEAKVRSK